MKSPEPGHKLISGRHAIHGATAVGTAQVVKILAQMVSVVVLSRLLSPSDFGVIAMTSPISGFVLIFQHLGLNQAAVQAKTLTHAQQSALFRYNVLASIAIAVLFVALSPAVAWFYDDVRAGYTIAAFAVNVMINGLGMQHSAGLNRQMRFSTIATIDGLTSVVMLCVTIAAAVVLKSYWALWVGALVSAIWSTSAAWYANDWRPSRRVRLSDANSLFKFGLNVTGANMLSFAMRNVDNILIAKVWGAAALGLYDRAYKLMLFPTQNLSRPLGQIFIPILSRLVEQPERYRRAYLTVLRIMCMAMIPGAITAAATADTLIPLLLGPQWIAAAPIFFWLSLTMITQPVGSTNQWLFLSTGRAHLMLRWTMVGAPTSIAAFAIGVAWGPEGVAAAYCIASFLKQPFLVQRFTDSTPVAARDVYHRLIVTTAGAAAGLGIFYGLGGMTLSGVILIAATGFAVYAGALAFNLASTDGRTDVMFTVSQLRAAVRRKG